MAPGQVIDRNRPACCGAVESFVHAKHKDAHRQKIKGARSLINNGWSQREEDKLKTSRRNAKREQLQEDRFQNIERENVRLLMRMQEIDKKKEARAREAGKAAAKLVLGGAQHAPSNGAVVGLPRSSSCPAGPGRGSNYGARCQEMRRIDDENRRLLKRLQAAKPSVNRSKLEEQHQAQQRFMRLRRENLSREEMLDPAFRPPRFPVFEVPSSCRSNSSSAADRSKDASFRLFHLQEALNETMETDEHGAVQADAGDTALDEREYVGGKLPEASRALAAALMEEHFNEAQATDAEPLSSDSAQEGPGKSGQVAPRDAEEAVEFSKKAAAEHLAAAQALDAQVYQAVEAFGALGGGGGGGGGDELGYENVVARSRASLQAADALLAGGARDGGLLCY